MERKIEKLLTPGEVMQALRIEQGTFYRLVKSGELPAVKVGGVYRLRPAQLEAFLRASEVRVPGRKVQRTQLSNDVRVQ